MSMANSILTFAVEGADLAIKNLASIKSPTLRKRIVQRAAFTLIRSSRSRITSQTDINGKPFGPYSDNSHHRRPRKGNRKMLARLIRNLVITDLSEFGGAIGWRNAVEGTIAGKHNAGYSYRFKKAWIQKESDGTRQDLDYYKNPATRKQASALLAEGYKIRRKGGKGAWKTPTIKWITQNLTIGRAGLILDLLRNNKGVDEWNITIPKRQFLGITADDLETIAAAINTEYEKAFAGAAA